jgi:cytochrome c peroxidase
MSFPSALQHRQYPRWPRILRPLLTLIVALAIGLGLAIGLKPSSATPIPPSIALIVNATQAPAPIQPLPQLKVLRPPVIRLGAQLFNDPILSHDRGSSCASCHQFNQGGADGLPQSIGNQGVPLTLNSPTVFNSGLNSAQFWDGHADSLEAQIDGPIHDSREFATDWPTVIRRLKAQPDYAQAFQTIYPGRGISEATIKDAIANFERSLLTPSRFDQFLQGKATLTPTEKAGYKAFQDYGCVACHQGMNVGGNLYQRLGLIKPYYTAQNPAKPADQGRMAVTHDKLDQYMFKVPSLRNVTLTAPYFHDGQIKTLAAAIRIMAEYQLGRPIPEADIDHIIAFLKTLEGQPQSIALVEAQ